MIRKIITPEELEVFLRKHKLWLVGDPDFIYRVGETVEVKDFDEDRWNECAPGIHFFITRQEAVEY